MGSAKASNPESRGAIRIIAVACLIFGSAWLAVAAPFFLRQLDVKRHWPQSNAKLRRVAVVEESSSGEKLFKTHFEFSVEAPGGARGAVVDGYRISSDRSKVEAEAARFLPGASYSVRCNPRDSAEIRLDVDRPLRHFFIPITFAGIASIFFVIAGSLVFFSRA
jgi:hypothetical protein